MPRPRSDRPTPARVVSHLVVMVAVAGVLGVIVAGLAIPFAGVVGIGARNVATTMDDLPAELKTEALPQKTRILDSKGNTIATLYDENRVEVPLSQISRIMVKSIVAIEDYRFYEHGALDIRGTLRAFITNQANAGVVQGGSSITQQLVKLTLLSQATTPRERREATDDSYARKLRELRYAVALEENHTKDWILERYLNIAYFGDGAYGIQSAARHYFDVNARELDLRQSATLAGLVKNPTGYDPTNYPDKALERRNVVLDRMAELNIVPQDRVDAVKDQKLGLDTTNTSNGCVFSAAPFFCDYTINYLLEDPALGKTKQERRDLLYSGGLTIRTTLDQRFQKSADTAVRAHVYAKDDAIGGLAMVEPGTGEVKAIAQSRPMGRNKDQGETYLDFAVNQKYGDSAGFQGGSTFKAFVLAAAIDQGVPLTQGFDSPSPLTVSESEYEDCDGDPYGYASWTVDNSTTSGFKDMYSGTRESVNTFFIQLEQLTGICEPYRLAKRMGVDLTNPTGDGAERVPSFTLGAADVSPLEMAEAYATFGARGLHCDAHPVTTIEDAAGNTLKEYDDHCQQVMEKTTADAVSDILRGVLEGGFASAQQLSVPAAGKTGTTTSGRSVWFVGYTPAIATAAMIAGANRQGTPISLDGQYVGGVYIGDVSGSGYAAPIWGDAMRGIIDLLPYKDFVSPSAEVVEGDTEPVPFVGGMSLDEAERILQEAGFETVVGSYVNSSYASGTVAYTSPSDSAVEGSAITIYQSNGTPPAPTNTPDPGDGGDGGGDGGDDGDDGGDTGGGGTPEGNPGGPGGR